MLLYSLWRFFYLSLKLLPFPWQWLYQCHCIFIPNWTSKLLSDRNQLAEQEFNYPISYIQVTLIFFSIDYSLLLSLRIVYINNIYIISKNLLKQIYIRNMIKDRQWIYSSCKYCGFFFFFRTGKGHIIHTNMDKHVYFNT